MTQDEIIRMAVQCQLVTTGNRDGMYADALINFAHLVAAHEREACAQVAFSWNTAMTDKIAEEIRARGQA